MTAQKYRFVLLLAPAALCADGYASSSCVGDGSNVSGAVVCIQHVISQAEREAALKTVKETEESRRELEAKKISETAKSGIVVASDTAANTGAADASQEGAAGNAKVSAKAKREIFQSAYRHAAQVQKSLKTIKSLIQRLEQFRESQIYSDGRSTLMRDPEAVFRANRDLEYLREAQKKLESEFENTERQAVSAASAAEELEKLSGAAKKEEGFLDSLSAKDAAALAPLASSLTGGAGGKDSGSAATIPGSIAKTPSLSSHSLSSSSYDEAALLPSRSSSNRADDAAGSADKKLPNATGSYGAGVSSMGGHTAPWSGGSIGNLKEKLRSERVAAEKDSPGSDGKQGKSRTAPGSPETVADGAPSSNESVDTSPFGAGDLGLSMSLGDSGSFGDMLKDVLGVSPELTEEERALQASRALASIETSEALPPEVLAADTESLFQRTRQRIEIALKKGKVMNGLNSKL
ncbi:MAG: hypothetical protein HUU37_03580 [Bdellovibrionales bacterium]|nr:hypothetical protein [Bdellovibrionales bacterium]